MNNFRRSAGYTLIEMMAVTAVIGILATVAITKFVDLVNRAREAETKGNLGALRSTLTIAYSSAEGQFPATFNELIPTYINRVPTIRLSSHNESNAMIVVTDNSVGPAITNLLDWGTWAYVAGASHKAQFGDVLISCTHADTKGLFFSGY